MFCPECGAEDRQANQFCRACGLDMRRIPNAAGSPDSVTAAAISAREEIGRSISSKIKDFRTPEELAEFTENVLPEIEKFLEPPEQRRMRRLRAGTITASVGIGTAVGISLVALATNEDEIMFLAALGVVTFFIGIALILNGIFLTVPKGKSHGNSSAKEPAPTFEAPGGSTVQLPFPPASEVFNSVTESTTRQLDEARARRSKD